jgi:hypothetical protein
VSVKNIEINISHRNKYMERKFHREKKTIELIETLVECIEFWSKLCANGNFFYCGISLPYIYFYDISLPYIYFYGKESTMKKALFDISFLNIFYVNKKSKQNT